MAGRPKHYEDEELIDSAIKVFWKKGYHASSAQDLMKGMNIGQGSFYRSFPGGKKELYHNSLNLFFKKSITKFHEGLAKSEDPLVFIKQFFYAIAERNLNQSKKGCYLGNAIVELSNIDNDTETLSIALLTKLREAFETALKKAQIDKKLSSQKSPSAIALHLINLWNGINVTMRMNPKKNEIEALINMNLKMLE